MNTVQEFTASMYGIKNWTNVDDARYRIFMKNYYTKEDSEHFKKNTTILDIINSENFTNYFRKLHVA